MYTLYISFHLIPFYHTSSFLIFFACMHVCILFCILPNSLAQTSTHTLSHTYIRTHLRTYVWFILFLCLPVRMHFFPQLTHAPPYKDMRTHLHTHERTHILAYFSGFMASLSINLAVLNSLPFPSLDGGQLLFVVAEVVAGTYARDSVMNWLEMRYTVLHWVSWMSPDNVAWCRLVLHSISLSHPPPPVPSPPTPLPSFTHFGWCLPPPLRSSHSASHQRHSNRTGFQFPSRSRSFHISRSVITDYLFWTQWGWLIADPLLISDLPL